MIMRMGLCLGVCAFWSLCTVTAQDVQVSSSNKTIQVNASATVRVEPEIARMRFGFKNYGATQRIAIDQNIQAANKITKTLMDSGIPRDVIETETIRVDRTRDTEYGAGKGAAEEFVAIQEWTVNIQVAEAERALQLAIQAGANMVQEVEWVVSKPEDLSSKTNSVALQKARGMAEQMAKQMGAKLGDLLYLSNSEPQRFTRFDRPGGGGGDGMAYKLAPPPPPPIPLHLFPAKVEENATVTAVFAIE